MALVAIEGSSLVVVQHRYHRHDWASRFEDIVPCSRMYLKVFADLTVTATEGVIVLPTFLLRSHVLSSPPSP